MQRVQGVFFRRFEVGQDHSENEDCERLWPPAKLIIDMGLLIIKTYLITMSKTICEN